MQIVCNVISRVVIRLVFTWEFIMIRLGSLERDYSLFRGVITLDKCREDHNTADMPA